eukprot:m51a1_g7052 putative calpain family cysteine protease (909) ;mRNA; f:150075-152949
MNPEAYMYPAPPPQYLCPAPAQCQYDRASLAPQQQQQQPGQQCAVTDAHAFVMAAAASDSTGSALVGLVPGQACQAPAPYVQQQQYAYQYQYPNQQQCQNQYAVQGQCHQFAQYAPPSHSSAQQGYQAQAQQGSPCPYQSHSPGQQGSPYQSQSPGQQGYQEQYQQYPSQSPGYQGQFASPTPQGSQYPYQSQSPQYPSQSPGQQGYCAVSQPVAQQAVPCGYQYPHEQFAAAPAPQHAALSFLQQPGHAAQAPPQYLAQQPQPQPQQPVYKYAQARAEQPSGHSAPQSPAQTPSHSPAPGHHQSAPSSPAVAAASGPQQWQSPSPHCSPTHSPAPGQAPSQLSFLQSATACVQQQLEQLSLQHGATTPVVNPELSLDDFYESRVPTHFWAPAAPELAEPSPPPSPPPLEDLPPAPEPPAEEKKKRDERKKRRHSRHSHKPPASAKPAQAAGSLYRERPVGLRIKRTNERMVEVLERCAKTGEFWRDPEFAPQAGWEPAHEFLKDARLFHEGIEPGDIHQGELGDCYLLSSLSVLAERSHRIENLFCAHEDNGWGVFCVTVFHNGERKDVLVDDYFPVTKSGGKCRPRYSRNNGPELWVMVVEKAYAKLHGSYKAIESGAEATALTDLTGAPLINYRIKAGTEADKLFQTLDMHDTADHVMCCNIDASKSAAAEKKLGLVTQHSYALLRTAEIPVDGGKTEKLVQLRNPWGNTEWNGTSSGAHFYIGWAWSDKDVRWTSELREQLKAPVRDDGQFWMNIGDFCKHFGIVIVLLIKDGFRSRTIGHQMKSKREGFSVVVASECKLSLTLFQRDVPKMGALRMCLLDEYKGDKAKPRARASSAKAFTVSEELFSSEVHLAAGRYVLVLEAHPEYGLPKVTVGMYGNFDNGLTITPIGGIQEGRYAFEEVV